MIKNLVIRRLMLVLLEEYENKANDQYWFCAYTFVCQNLSIAI